jgi:hypothetical protein
MADQQAFANKHPSTYGCDRRSQETVACQYESVMRTAEALEGHGD